MKANIDKTVNDILKTKVKGNAEKIKKLKAILDNPSFSGKGKDSVHYMHELSGATATMICVAAPIVFPGENIEPGSAKWGESMQKWVALHNYNV